MKVWRHWAKEATHVTTPGGRALDLAAWGASATSADDARRQARESLAAAVRRVAAGQDLDRYGYADRPLREEIIEELDDRTAAPLAIITRNSYGALVLNTRDAMFIDVDIEPERKRGLARVVAGLFGREPEPAEHPGLARLREAASRWPEMGLRVYRTCKGLRCLVTTATYDPKSPEVREILNGFASDPLYVRLCTVQECFRARLTPKHWRIGMPPPPQRFPRVDAAEQELHARWVRAYDERAASFSTCDMLTTIGPARIAPEIEPIVTLHDRHTLSPSGAPLA